jgi:predicted N-acetyltransferase YhbS
MSFTVTVRVMKPSDLDAIAAIDEKITGTARQEYYQYRLEVAGRSDTQLNASLVAEADGKVVGFLMGTLYFARFGIPETSAMVDALGVDPEAQDRGVGSALAEQFRSNMKAARVEKIYTLVDWADLDLLKFFGNQGFVPSQRLSLECRVF